MGGGELDARAIQQ